MEDNSTVARIVVMEFTSTLTLLSPTLLFIKSRVFDKIFGLDQIGSVQTIVEPIYYL